jgi:hypothetical protein
MVDPVFFRESIRKNISQDFEIEFLGKNFDQIVSLLSFTKAEKIFSWISEVINKKIQPIVVSSGLM